jgi:S-adenosylmethionine synthetase
MVETFGTATAQAKDLAGVLSKEFDLTPSGIIHELHLKRPIYFPTASYGHFGRADIQLPWE